MHFVLAQVSEGLDFADRAGRAVIVTGMPFATPTDPKVCFFCLMCNCIPKTLLQGNIVHVFTFLSVLFFHCQLCTKNIHVLCTHISLAIWIS